MVRQPLRVRAYAGTNTRDWVMDGSRSPSCRPSLYEMRLACCRQPQDQAPRIKSGLVVCFGVALLANLVVGRRFLAALMFAILARGHSWLAAFLLVISPNEGWPSD